MMARVKKAIAKRRDVADKFRLANNYSWDYVLVFKVYLEDEKLCEFQKSNSLKNILAALAAGGLETKLFYSAQVRLANIKLVVVLIVNRRMKCTAKSDHR